MRTIQANTTRASVENVLRLWRQLPPRERFQVVAQALPELERDLSRDNLWANFWQDVDIQTLIEQQGVKPVRDWEAWLGGWPEDEPLDDFIAALRAWRQNNPALAGVE